MALPVQTGRGYDDLNGPLTGWLRCFAADWPRSHWLQLRWPAPRR